MKKGDKIYITKYALTAGIKTATAHSCSDNFVFICGDYNFITSFYIGREAFTDLDEAKKRAEEMRAKKIESLKKQIEKLSKMEIKINDQL